ncbi:MAG: hypothetical protein IJ682_04025 [Lachnospiraceae bacterium]|nr:hypothetical protein [Lachnospiraceae bacterium]
MNVSKIENHTIFQLFSPLNDWIDYVFVIPDEDAESALNIIQSAYDDWNKTDTDTLISDYIAEKLSASDIACEVYATA